MPQIKARHAIGVLTAGVIALAAGTATQQGFIPRWEGGVKEVQVAVHLPFDRRGVYTVCSGLTNADIKDLKPGDVYTRAMCDDAEAAALPKYNDGLVRVLGADFLVSTHMHVALLSFIYNIGEHAFANSTVARELKAGHREAACRAMGMYTRANGVVLKGLQNRRYDKFWGEIAWCLRDD